MGVVRLRIVAALDCGATNKHGDSLAQLFQEINSQRVFYGITFGFWRHAPLILKENILKKGQKSMKSAGFHERWVKQTRDNFQLVKRSRPILSIRQPPFALHS
jgi:hypothetical protein